MPMRANHYPLAWLFIARGGTRHRARSSVAELWTLGGFAEEALGWGASGVGPCPSFNARHPVKTHQEKGGGAPL